MSSADFLLARSVTALIEGDPAEAERLIRSIPEESRDCRHRAVVAIARSRLGGANVEDGDCQGHPAWAAVRIACARREEVIQAVEEAVTAGVPPDHLPLLVDAAERRASEFMAASEYGRCLAVHALLGHLSDDRDRLAWALGKVVERVEVEGDYMALSRDMSSMDDGLGKEMALAVERQYITAIQRERFDRAIEYLRHFGALDGARLVSALVDAGRNAETYGTPADAIQWYRMASGLTEDVGLRSDMAVRVREIARRAIDSGNLDLGLRVLGEMSAFGDVTMHDELRQVAHGLVREGRYGEAVDLYLRLGDERPGDRTVYHIKDIANRLRTEGRVDEAVELYGKLAVLDPTFDIDHYLVLAGTELARDGHHEKALGLLACVATPEPDLLLARAGSLEALGRDEAARAALEEAVLAWPSDVKVLRAMLELCERKGDEARAYSVARKARRLEGSAGWTENSIKRGLSRRIAAAEGRSDYAKAVDLYAEYLGVFPDDRWARQRMDLVLDILRLRDRKAWKAAMERLGREPPRRTFFPRRGARRRR